MRHRSILGLLVVGGLLTGVSVGSAYPRGGDTELLSARRIEKGDCNTRIDGVPATQTSFETGVIDAAISNNGRYVAFDSRYCDLVENDDNAAADVFLYDRKTREIEMLSRTPIGTAPTYDPVSNQRGSFAPTFSANGRYVAFISSALDLVPGAVTPGFNVYLRDLKTDTTELITRILNLPVNVSVANFYYPSLSADGRLVAFSGSALLLGLSDSTSSQDVMVHDRSTGETKVVSVNSRGEQSKTGFPPSDSTCPSITPDGTQVVFSSGAMDLVDDDTTVWGDVFVHDMRTGKTERVSLATGGRQAEQGSLGTNGCGGGSFSSNEAMTGDGRTVAFNSGLRDYVPSDANDVIPANSGQDVFIHDRETQRTDRVSVSSYGEEHPMIGGNNGAISLDGRYVIFQGPDDLQNPTNPRLAVTPYDGWAVYLYDRRTFALERLDPPPNEQRCKDAGVPADITPNGRWMPFTTCYALTPEDNRTSSDPDPDDIDLYVRDRGLPVLGGLARSASTAPRVSGVPGLDTDGFASVVDLRDSSSPADYAGANIIGVDLAHRPSLGDLFFRVELDRMPTVLGGALSVVGNPLLVYGISFTYNERDYEMRIGKVGSAPKFGLFECEGDVCSELTTLRGGYGTIGVSVAASLPLEAIAFEGSGTIENVKAFSALGSYDLGPQLILDTTKVGDQ